MQLYSIIKDRVQQEGDYYEYALSILSYVKEQGGFVWHGTGTGNLDPTDLTQEYFDKPSTGISFTEINFIYIKALTALSLSFDGGTLSLETNETALIEGTYLPSLFTITGEYQIALGGQVPVEEYSCPVPRYELQLAGVEGISGFYTLEREGDLYRTRVTKTTEVEIILEFLDDMELTFNIDQEYKLTRPYSSCIMNTWIDGRPLGVGDYDFTNASIFLRAL